MIGFGAGRAYFYSDVILVNGDSKSEVARIEVRKASWLLGGGIASAQNAQNLLHTASQVVSEEVIMEIEKN